LPRPPRTTLFPYTTLFRSSTFQGAAMQLAMIGLGRMGGNMVQRLLQGGHELIVYDSSADAVKAHVAKGVKGAKDLADVAKQLARSEEHTSELQSRGHLVCR